MIERVLEHLVKTGAFDFSRASRRRIFDGIDAAIAAGNARARDKAAGQDTFLGMLAGPAAPGNGAGHRVELVSLNWQLLALELGQAGPDASARREFQHRVFSEGSVGGRRVPCISAEVQLLFHTDFELAPAHRHDVTLLNDELGASLPEPEAR